MSYLHYPPMISRSGAFLFCLFILLTKQGLAQHGPVLPLDDPALWHTNALLASGYLGSIEASSFPVAESNYLHALQQITSGDFVVNSIVNGSISRLASQNGASKTNYGIRIRPGVSVSTQEGADFLNPEPDYVSVVYSMVSYESWFTAGGFTAAWGWRHDRYYDRDPDGLDSAHRWAIRPENAYVSYQGAYGNIRLGRVRQHWGGFEQPGLVLSDNPRPMDHISYQIGTPKLHISSSLSELDSITGDGRFTGTAGDDSVSVGSERRYLASHRLTIAKPGSWSVGLMHSILYSGANSGFSLKFANPFQVAILSVDERPKNDENNGLIGAFVQINRPNTLYQAQLALDDIDILNGREPASIAATAHVYRANLFSRTDLSLGSTIVTARTYNADQPEGKYIYLNRGIATQFSDFVSGFVELPIFLTQSAVITPRFDLLIQGEGDIRKPFPRHEDVPTIFEGVVERTLRFSVEGKIRLSNLFDVYGSMGLSTVSNQDHEDGKSGNFLSGMLSISYRKMWSGNLN